MLWPMASEIYKRREYSTKPTTTPFPLCEGCDPADAGILVTIGPEGGWVEPDELELLQSFGFQVCVLRSVFYSAYNSLAPPV